MSLYSTSVLPCPCFTYFLGGRGSLKRLILLLLIPRYYFSPHLSLPVKGTLLLGHSPFMCYLQDQGGGSIAPDRTLAIFVLTGKKDIRVHKIKRDLETGLCAHDWDKDKGQDTPCPLIHSRFSRPLPHLRALRLLGQHWYFLY